MSVVLRHAVAEARRVRRDPGALLVLVGAVVLYAFFYPVPYLPEVLREVPLAVVDLDATPLSRQLVRLADAHSLLEVRERPTTLAEAERLVLAGRAAGILVVPEGFERDVRRRRGAKVGAFADASYFLVYRQVATGLLETVGALSAGIERRRDPVSLVVRPLFNPAEGYASYVVPAVLVLILQQTLLIGIGLLGGTEAESRSRTAGDREEPALGRLLGRALFYVALYSLHALFYFAVVYRVYGFPERGRGLDLAMFALPFLLACVFLALFLSRLFPRRETAMQVLLFTSLPSVFLAGFAWPVEALPAWLRASSLLLPSTTGIAGFLRLSGMGAELRHVRFEWSVLWALAAAYLALAWLAERRTGKELNSPPGALRPAPPNGG